MKYTIIALLIIAGLCSCKQKNQSGVEETSASYDYELVKADKKKSFELDSETEYGRWFLFVVVCGQRERIPLFSELQNKPVTVLRL